MSFKARVEALGGKLTTCHPKTVVIGSHNEKTQGCGHDTRAVIPYERADGKPGFAVACAHCDMAREFPRLR